MNPGHSTLNLLDRSPPKQRDAAQEWQGAFPVMSPDGKVVGVITPEILRTVAQEPSVANLTIAHDMMVPPAIVQDSADVSSALRLLLVHGAREVIVVDDRGEIVGFLDEHEITRLYLTSTHAPTLDARPTASPPRKGGRATRIGS